MDDKELYIHLQGEDENGNPVELEKALCGRCGHPKDDHMYDEYSSVKEGCTANDDTCSCSGYDANTLTCRCPTECDCEDADSGLKSNECPIHNHNPYPSDTCPIHGTGEIFALPYDQAQEG